MSPKDSDTFLCLTCGHVFVPPGEAAGQTEVDSPRCPLCRSAHVLNITATKQGCGADSGGFTFGYG